ncbi:MBL fold metallo-hydrolase [Virgibacillus sp. C22-A2]|uniref:MBL fold metallo-hydrolase n=1 Tax=Virgibacillus tibetensis TaxID=3042313 RepID=A0ABU6KEQ7_9BACI|nr:MBL fold metallo-hydrolase [Virgibacillus sp. C22-A2]
MNLIKLTNECYYFDAPVNIGYVHHGEKGMLIDAGIDDSVMRKALKQLAEKNLPITHLFITHAHADHYGGASFLQKSHRIHTMAPIFEAAILANPTLEPLYLFSGNEPLPELNNKFLQGKAIQVDQTLDEGDHEVDGFTFKTYLLPGHSYRQLAMEIGGILYAGDSYFSEDQLYKHKIPYITEASLTIESLYKLLDVSCDGAVPGHGIFEKEFKSTVKKNITYHEELLGWLYDEIKSHANGISHESVVANMCEHYGVQSPGLSQWLLYRTAATAYLVGLIKHKKISHTIKSSKWIFHADT